MSVRRLPTAMQAGSTALLLTLAAGIGAPFVPAAQAQAVTPAGVVELSPTPPGDTQAVAPNIALTFDDSGSMSYAYMPDNVPDKWGDNCKNNTDYTNNTIYYNPSITYLPPMNADGSSFEDMKLNAARVDGFYAKLGHGKDLVDLSSNYYPTETWNTTNSGKDSTFSKCGQSKGAYYFDPVSKKNIFLASGTAEQKKNFANWYSYYRTRSLMTKTAVSRAFAKLQSPVRMVWQTIWPAASNRPWSRGLSTSDPIGPFQDVTNVNGDVVATGNKPDFFDWLFGLGSSNGTPDRKAAQRAGDYFVLNKGDSRTGKSSDPYWNGLAGTDSKELVCRQNYHVMVTDGYWNEKDSEVVEPAKISDNMSQTPDGKAEKVDESSIYWKMASKNTKSFANIAYHYWATDLAPGLEDKVSPYLADTTHTLWNKSYDADKPWDNKEVYFNPKNDPATWQHLVQFVVTLGIDGELGQGDYDALRKGNKSWPKPVADQASAIDDMWHAAINSRGSYTSAGNPAALVESLSRILSDIGGRGARATTSAVNASVLVTGALGFNAGYDSSNWSGVLQAVTLKEDGTTAGVVWDAGAKLNAATASTRQILTSKQKSDGSFDSGIAFRADAAFDTKAAALLMKPTPAASATSDTLANRVDYLRGERGQENAGTMRKRSNLLGAIVNSQAVYVSYPGSGYYNNWPAGSPEAAKGAQSYDDFVSNNVDRAGTLYVGANDGMLHAFDASLDCSTKDKDGKCTSYGPAQSATAGGERWAYVPRAVYANLGNLTSNDSFKYAPTVDGSPSVRDVFFDDAKWHSLLVGNLRLGGRGVYALDVTDPTKVTESSAASKVLWEFTADAPAVTGVGDPADLGYTYGQPGIGRLANGKWVVLVPTGYYPDCAQTSKPANCETLPAASNKYSALFVLDAQTGAMIAELKTPTDIKDVSSFGLGSVVLGDYNNDQIDDVAFAGDLAGNLWRFDLSDKNPANWKVTLAFQPTTQKAQPITVMPRLFPDPGTNRFMVVFGTGKYLGAKDSLSQGMAAQAIYGIRDLVTATGTPYTVKQSDDKLVAQTLTEEGGKSPLDGTIVRKLTANPMKADSQGWRIELAIKDSSSKLTNAGERVVVTPAALFASNTAVFSTLIPGSTDPCNPVVQGSVMFIDITNGGPGGGVSLLGGYPYVGARVDNVRTSGSLPVTTTVGGGKTVLPGLTMTGRKDKPNEPFSGDAPIWRRRSWSELNDAQ